MSKHLNAPVCAEYLKALGDPVRLRIVECLQAGPRIVSAIAEELGGGIAQASHHLQVLLHAGLVVSRRKGRFVEYALHPELLVRGSATRPSALEFGCCRIELGERSSRC